MTKNRKLIIAAVAAVVGVGAIAGTAAVAHDRGGWKKAGYSHFGGHHGKGKHKFRQHAERLFNQFDADKDGKVTDAEIKQFRAASIAEFDANKDGAIQLDEFQGLWVKQVRPMMVDHFQFLDDDGDGQITDAELAGPMDRVTQYLDRNDDGAIAKDELRPRGHRWHDRDDDDDDDDDRKRGG